MVTALVTIEYFGPAKNYTENRSDEKISLHSSASSNDDKPTLNDLISYLSTKYGENFGDFIMKTCGIALNYEYLELNRDFNDESTLVSRRKEFGKDVHIEDGDNVTIIPPVSSG